MQNHFTALWDHGRIKFWSVNSLQTQLNDAGLREISFLSAGRVPAWLNQ